MEKERKLNVKHGSISFLLALFLPTIVGIIWQTISTSLKINNSVYYYVALALTQLTFLLIFFIVTKTSKINYKQENRINFKLNYKQIILIATCGLVALFSFSPLVNLLDAVLKSIGYNVGQSFNIDLSNFGMLIVNILIVGILPAICEELIFRGIILNSFRKYNKVGAILLSALMFMIMHMSIEQSIYQFVLGIILGVVAWETGSLLASVILHAVNNITVLVVNYITIMQGAQTQEVAFEFTAWNILSPILIALAGLLIVFFVLRVLSKLCKVKNNNNHSTEQTICSENNSQNIENSNLAEQNNGLSQNNQVNGHGLLLIGSILIGVILWVSSFIISLMG